VIAYEVVIVGQRPKRPEAMSERVYALRLENLGGLFVSEWEVRPRTLRAIFHIDSDGGKVLDDRPRYRPKDATWAAEKALHCWRAEMSLLVGAIGDKPQAEWQAFRVSVQPARGHRRGR
jgi:hypothetical protein